MSFTLPAVLVYFRSYVSWNTIELMRQDQDKYRGLTDNPDYAEVLEAADGPDLNALFEKDL